MYKNAGLLAAGCLMAAAWGIESAAAEEVNIYSARHYDVDHELYEEFTERTGIEVNRIEGDSDALLQRIVNEGRNTPADVFITVDAGRLWRAEDAGVFAEVDSEVLRERIPESVRHPDGLWFGFSQRLRLIFYDKERFDAPPVETYEDLADPALRGEVCIRSSGNVYNQSLLASLIAHHGDEWAEEWAEGVVANFARQPQGGDTDQIRGVAAGECGVAVANHYYYLRLLDNEPEVAAAVGLVFPNQEDRGVHANVSGAGVVAHGPNGDNAVRFLEFLASDFAQKHFADANNEYPVVAGVAPSTRAQDIGEFEIDPVNVAVYGTNQAQAQMIFDRVGWR